MGWRLPCIFISSVFKHHSIPQANTITRTLILSYHIIGDNEATNPDLPPVVIVHGFLSNKKNWYQIGKTLLNTTKRSVVTVDVRNHGQSPHVNTQRYDEMADDLIKLFDKLAIKKASIIGHCMGGRICMYLALTQPKPVAGLLVVDMSPLSTPPQFRKLFSSLIDAMMNIKITEKTKDQAMKKARKELSSIIKSQEHVKALVNAIGRDSKGKLVWRHNLKALKDNFDFVENFPINSLLGKQYTGPTLFLGGQLSEFIPPDELPIIKEFFPQAVIKYVPKAAHYPHLTYPETFMEHTIDFIKRTDK